MEDNKILQLYFDRNESAISFTKYKYGSRLNNIAYRILIDFGIQKSVKMILT